MKVQTRVLIILLALVSTLMSGGRFISVESSEGATHAPERLRFRITTIEESAGQRNVISDATVEGPPGTDFNISLQGERFKMSAQFLTDLMARDSLRVRAKLDTRRFYGYSEQHLPLYEEDKQNQALDVGFDESVVLLPFGRGGVDNRLKIEIVPVVSEQAARLPDGKARPLEINILKPGPGGVIGIQAWKIPHRFDVEATLLEDGREVARGETDSLIEETKEVILRPTEQVSPELAANPLAVNLSINEYTRSRPQDLATIGFDVYLPDAQGGRREAIGLNWAGVGELGSNLTYDLSDVYLKGSGKKYELRFKINLAQGERAD
ncbi:MAG: hypothetical protein QOJ02_1489 [Acidobacteriota bacterium]|jgi:hypothetical protein|nr:hypothetical protein [Acidobacteriota bacterium]